jgi:hypothetical protein
VVTVNPDPPCPDDTITFTVSHVTDSGGQKRENCVLETIAPVAPTYEWELTLPADYPPPLPPLIGIGASVAVTAKAPGNYRVTFTAKANRDCPPPDRVLVATVVVPDVTVLEWQALPGNIALDVCPNNGDKRIFPGKQTPGDGAAADRRKVHLKATLNPVVQGCTVHFRTWDVDDPFDQNHPGMPNVQLIDNNATGPDNRPTPEGPVPLVGTTDAQGEATVTFTVSMQPGNNYLAGASGIIDAINAATQVDADANNAPPRVRFTEMLTVWRKLHVETDSMAAVTGNKIDTAFTGIVGSGTALTEINGLSSLDDQSANLDKTPPGNGRFEDGALAIGGGPVPITISPVTANGSNRVVFPSMSIAGLPFSAEDNDDFWNGTMSGTITEVVESGIDFVWTLNVTAHNEDPIDWPDFVGGKLTVGEGAEVDIVAVNGAASQVTTSALNIPCRVHDDDDDSLLAKLPDVGAMGAAYREAYVVPVYDVGDNDMNVPFVLNITATEAANTGTMDWDSQTANAADFWVVYLLAAFQHRTTEDADPDSETRTFGATPGTGGGSLIYLEVDQGHEGVSNPVAKEQITVVHESGHAVGDSGDHPVTTNSDQSSTFVANYLVHIRASTRPSP